MFAVPGFLMGHSSIPGADVFPVAAWCFGIPGLILSYYTAITYIPTIRARSVPGGSHRRPDAQRSSVVLDRLRRETVRLGP